MKNDFYAFTPEEALEKLNASLADEADGIESHSQDILDFADARRTTALTVLAELGQQVVLQDGVYVLVEGE